PGRGLRGDPVLDRTGLPRDLHGAEPVRADADLLHRLRHPRAAAVPAAPTAARALEVPPLQPARHAPAPAEPPAPPGRTRAARHHELRLAPARPDPRPPLRPRPAAALVPLSSANRRFASKPLVSRGDQRTCDGAAMGANTS